MMSILGTFFGLKFSSERHFARKLRVIIQNKTNQEIMKKINRNLRLLKMKLFLERFI